VEINSVIRLLAKQQEFVQVIVGQEIIMSYIVLQQKHALTELMPLAVHIQELVIVHLADLTPEKFQVVVFNQLIQQQAY